MLVLLGMLAVAAWIPRAQADSVTAPKPSSRPLALPSRASAAAAEAAAEAAAGRHKGAVASAHPLASEAGREMLADGGNAFDAAVAVSAALAVVEPTSSGLGGGGFYLLHRETDGFETMLDAREKAPGAATRDM
jgi:gamma-glutamyltranspeptidase